MELGYLLTLRDMTRRASQYAPVIRTRVLSKEEDQALVNRACEYILNEVRKEMCSHKINIDGDGI